MLEGEGAGELIVGEIDVGEEWEGCEEGGIYAAGEMPLRHPQTPDAVGGAGYALPFAAVGGWRPLERRGGRNGDVVVE